MGEAEKRILEELNHSDKMSLRQVAMRLKVHPKAVWRAARAGKLEAIRIGGMHFTTWPAAMRWLASCQSRSQSAAVNHVAGAEVRMAS